MLNFRNKLKMRIFLFISFVLVPLSLYVGYISYNSLKNKELYIISFNENISGLEKGSSVLFNGVNVGYIKNIGINSNNDEIDIVICIRDNMKISNKVACIESQGFTGHKYINLSYSENIENKISWYNGMRKIASKKSEFATIIKKAPIIADQSSDLIEKFNKFDMQSLNNILNKLENSIKKVDNLLDSANKSVCNLNKILIDIHYATHAGRENTKEFFLKSIPKLNSSALHLNELLIDSSKMLKQFKEKPIKFLLNWYG